MHIGFDGRKAIQSFTGPGNYSRFVLNLLIRYEPENEYFLYSTKRPERALGIPEKIILRHSAKYTPTLLWRLKGISGAIKKDKIDLFHGLSNNLPPGVSRSKAPSVVTIHDLIFLRFPEFYSFIESAVYKYQYKYACTNATRIIAVSKQTKQDLITFFNIPEDKIDVVYQGCNSAFQEKASEKDKKNTRNLYKLPKRYILQVGLIEERKNLLLTIKALKSVPKEIKLVVVGRETDYATEVKHFIDAHNLGNRVIFLKNVPAKDMPAIYQCADIFVYPSEFEGFGIPVIEALYSGIPVIAATGSCLEEAGGPGSCYVHPKDDVQLAWNINSILNNPEKRKTMIRKGFEYVKTFSEEQLVSNLMNVYKKALNNA